MSVTTKDIARELGVSVVTVSKVVRNHADIGEETRQRVLKRIKELNYQPNPAARALVTGRSYAAGLIVPDWSTRSLQRWRPASPARCGERDIAF